MTKPLKSPSPKFPQNPRAQMIMQQRRASGRPHIRRQQALKKTTKMPRPRWFILGGVGLLGGLGLFFKNDIQTYFQNELIIIEGETGPIKIRPENADDLSTPHREKTIYKSLEQGSLEVGNETILRTPEEPIMQSPTLSDNFFERFDTSSEETPTHALSIDTTENQPSSNTPTHYTILHFNPIPINGSVTTQNPRYAIHLTTPTSMDEANILARRIESHTEVGPLIALHDKKSIVVDRGRGKDIDYRLEIGPLNDLEEAKRICQYLAPYGCLVVPQKN